MKAEEPSFLRLVGTLGVAGLLSGLVLVGVFLATKDQIEANQKARIRQAVCNIFAGTECDEEDVAQMTIVILKREGDSLIPFVEVEGEETSPTDLVYAAYNAQEASAEAFAGYAIYGEGFGFQDTIKVLYGYDPAREAIVGLEILGHLETPGLGDKITFDPDWMANFVELAVEPDIVGVKDGRDEPNECDVITGATISSDAVIRILNETNRDWLPLLPESPELPETPTETGE